MEIQVGFAIPSGEEVKIPISHLVVCGVTALSGKTTTLEALITRSGKKSVVFTTKIGEKQFSGAKEITPFFREKSDYEAVKSLIESYSREKIFLERGTLMQLCQGSKSLQDIKDSVDNTLTNSKLRSIEKEIYVRLQHYLENLIPQIKNSHLSKTLSIIPGVNVMNLEKFSPEVQSLIIQSVLDEVLANHKDTIVVLPEAWKFVPQKYNNPCKRSAESFIRQGATNGNYLWIDSQEMASVDKGILKQVSTWVLGYQSERNEVKHTLDQIPLPAKAKPSPDAIMTLKRGQFFLTSTDGMKLVYVWPSWLTFEQARKVAKGETNIIPKEDVDFLLNRSHPFREPLDGDQNSHSQYSELFTERVTRPEPEIPSPKFVEIEVGSRMGKSYAASNDIQRILQKEEDAGRMTVFSVPKGEVNLPVSNSMRISYLETKVTSLHNELFNKIEELEMKIRSGMSPVYMVSPLEKIQKSFQEEAKNHVLSSVNILDDDQKRILLFIETQGKGCSLTMILDKLLHLSATSGGTRDKYSKKIKEMEGLIRKDKNNVIYPNLKEYIREYCGVHGITEQEMQQVYDHVLAGAIVR